MEHKPDAEFVEYMEKEVCNPFLPAHTVLRMEQAFIAARGRYQTRVPEGWQAARAQGEPMAYACPDGCGCLWRDNGDGTMSLYGPKSQSCDVCEWLPLSHLVPVFGVSRHGDTLKPVGVARKSDNDLLTEAVFSATEVPPGTEVYTHPPSGANQRRAPDRVIQRLRNIQFAVRHEVDKTKESRFRVQDMVQEVIAMLTTGPNKPEQEWYCDSCGMKWEPEQCNGQQDDTCRYSKRPQPPQEQREG